MGNSLQIERLGNVKGQGQSVLCFKGPLTIENVSLFQSAIRREERFSTVILDLSDVPYIDSTALGALVAANVSRQKAGRRVVQTPAVTSLLTHYAKSGLGARTLSHIKWMLSGVYVFAIGQGTVPKDCNPAFDAKWQAKAKRSRQKIEYSLQGLTV